MKQNILIRKRKSVKKGVGKLMEYTTKHSNKNKTDSVEKRSQFIT